MGFELLFPKIFTTLRIMRSQNWWFGDPKTLRNTESNLSFFGSTDSQGIDFPPQKNLKKSTSKTDGQFKLPPSPPDHFTLGILGVALPGKDSGNYRNCQLPTKKLPRNPMVQSRDFFPKIGILMSKISCSFHRGDMRPLMSRGGFNVQQLSIIYKYHPSFYARCVCGLIPKYTLSPIIMEVENTYI